MIIANSADLGVHKADRYFWEILRKRLELDRLRHILLIDDFGAND
jgi:FMN phosphatase YigB (HAD superfamily)